MMNTIINVLKKKKRNLPLAQMTGREDWSGSFATYKTNSKIKVTINYLSSCWGEKKNPVLGAWASVSQHENPFL